MPFRDLFTAASTEAISLLAKFLAYDPKRRIGARDVRLLIKYISQATDSPSFQGTSSRIFLLNAQPHTSYQVTQAKGCRC